uniref:Uncharacterized protein n=1 Tax=Rhizophora mucronata TaxID=61149 RepID=A0A2P2MH37_RHIMU
MLNGHRMLRHNINSRQVRRGNVNIESVPSESSNFSVSSSARRSKSSLLQSSLLDVITLSAVIIWHCQYIRCNQTNREISKPHESCRHQKKQNIFIYAQK